MTGIEGFGIVRVSLVTNKLRPPPICYCGDWFRIHESLGCMTGIEGFGIVRVSLVTNKLRPSPYATAAIGFESIPIANLVTNLVLIEKSIINHVTSIFIITYYI
jgi:hypothetical protein